NCVTLDKILHQLSDYSVFIEWTLCYYALSSRIKIRWNLIKILGLKWI
ncbi:13789_t:CDS:1, partial [Dentiscutata heterogama]